MAQGVPETLGVQGVTGRRHLLGARVEGFVVRWRNTSPCPAPYHKPIPSPRVNPPVHVGRSQSTARHQAQDPDEAAVAELGRASWKVQGLLGLWGGV